MKYFLFVLLFVSTLGYSQQNLEGIWITKDNRPITFLPNGKANKGYIIVHNELMSWVKIKGNTLCYRDNEKNKTICSNYSIIGGTLTYNDPKFGKIIATKNVNGFTPQNLKTITVDSTMFFDYSTDKLFAGKCNDLSYKYFLPFYINPKFIQKNNIDSLTYTLVNSRIKDSVTVSEDIYQRVILYFKKGLISRMVVKHPTLDSIKLNDTWEKVEDVLNFYYSSDAKLDSMTTPNGTLKFDKDGWVIDEYGFKVWIKQERPIYWEYKNGLPFRSNETRDKNSYNYYRDYIYNETNQLKEILVHDSDYEGCIFNKYILEYDTNGVVKKLIGARVSNTFKKRESDTLVDIENNKYPTVIIGKQVWMAENLKTTQLNDGTPIPNIIANTSWEKLKAPAYCMLENNETNAKTYGLLYNWHAVNTKKLCPTGWHVPTKDEYITLKKSLSEYGMKGVGLKISDTIFWQHPHYRALNITGFSALPGGYRDTYGYFHDKQTIGSWWSSTSYKNSEHANELHLYHDGDAITIEFRRKELGCSVRCVKD